MTAAIKGNVQTPTGKLVSVTLQATPIPTPSKTTDGDIIVAGTIAEVTDGPVDATIKAGTYRITLTSASAVLAEREVTLADGQVIHLADILPASDPPAPGPGPGGGSPQPPEGTLIVDEAGKPIALASIKIVHSAAEAETLEDGTVYLLVDQATPGPTPPGPTPSVDPSVVSSASGQFSGDSFTVHADGQSGDRTIIAINTKAVADQAFTWPEGFQQLVEPYYIGTMRFTVAVGSWAQDLTVRSSHAVEAGWVAVTTRGGGTPVAGAVKKRQAEPAETVTCTAPAVPATVGLTLGLAFERSSASETVDQVTVSEGWERVAFAAQEGSNFQTVLAARRTAASGDLTVTYPNPQSANGAGVQVVIPRA